MAPARSRSRTPPVPHASSTTTGNTTTVTDSSAILLQDRLHELLSRLSTTVDRIKTWPGTTTTTTTSSSGTSTTATNHNSNKNTKSSNNNNDASMHIESTGKLIQAIRNVLQSIERVETSVKQHGSTHLCPVPVDLLELLDHQGGLNPECFARGLLQEAIGQLEGLKRRKVALEGLATAVQQGLEQKLQQQQQKQPKEEKEEEESTRKRQRSDGQDEDTAEPLAKKVHLEDERNPKTSQEDGTKGEPVG